MARKKDDLVQLFYRTLGHFITPRLRLYLARIIFASPNKQIVHSIETEPLERKMMVVICDCFCDKNFLDFLQSQAVLLRQKIVNEHHVNLITLPEEQRAVYDAVVHFMKAEGIPIMYSNAYEKESLWFNEGSVQ